MAGIAVMPHGRRRESLEMAARALFGDDFAGRVLAFDREAAIAYGDLFAARRRAGRPGSTADLMIASIARTNAASVVTRDAGGFEHRGLTVIDPWIAP
jgi:predicted nucleic acid-binding protein